jgi:hypothetical protein
MKAAASRELSYDKGLRIGKKNGYTAAGPRGATATYILSGDERRGRPPAGPFIAKYREQEGEWGGQDGFFEVILVTAAGEEGAPLQVSKHLSEGGSVGVLDIASFIDGLKAGMESRYRRWIKDKEDASREKERQANVEWKTR